MSFVLFCEALARVVYSVSLADSLGMVYTDEILHIQLTIDAYMNPYVHSYNHGDSFRRNPFFETFEDKGRLAAYTVPSVSFFPPFAREFVLFLRPDKWHQKSRIFSHLVFFGSQWKQAQCSSTFPKR